MQNYQLQETFATIDMERRAYCRNRRMRYSASLIAISKRDALMHDAIRRIASIKGISEANAVHHCVMRDEFGCLHGGSVSHLRWIMRTPKCLLRVWCDGMIKERDAADRAGGAA